MTVKYNKNCCGCGLCKYECPRKAISYKPDSEGFLKPEINEKLCINCGLCLEKCILNKNSFSNDFDQKFYAVQTKDSEVYQNSSSGGIFGTIAKEVILQGGVVFACEISNSKHLQICRITNIHCLQKLYGSKYGQSYENGSFLLVKEDLEKGKSVLFCALPCQIYALKVFLKQDYKNLFCIDLICHGVPSYDFFSSYFNYLEFKKKILIKSINFRTKKNIPWGYELGITYDKNRKNKFVYLPYFADKYFFSFSQGNNLNYSCYKCMFSSFSRNSDITIGDFWNIDKSLAEKFPKTAISVIMVNSEKGRKMLSCVASKSLAIHQVQKALVQKSNSELVKRNGIPEDREHFYDGFNEDKVKFINNLPVSKNKLLYIKYYIKTIIKRTK